MKVFGLVAMAVILAGCSATTKSADVSDAVRKALDQSGYKDVSVSEDRDKGVVTLKGHVPADSDKAQAERLAKGMAGDLVVADEIIVLPPGGESAAKAVNSDLDNAIDKLLDAALIQTSLHDNVKYSTKNGVITLTGNVTSQQIRDQAQAIAAGIPNVQQVVNELQVKDQKATGTN
jgi:hyperosmotically inducible protein